MDYLLRRGFAVNAFAGLDFEYAEIRCTVRMHGVFCATWRADLLRPDRAYEPPVSLDCGLDRMAARLLVLSRAEAAVSRQDHSPIDEPDRCGLECREEQKQQGDRENRQTVQRYREKQRELKG